MSKYGRTFWEKEIGKDWTLVLKYLLKTPYGDKLIDFLNVEYAMQKVNPSKMSQVFLPFRTCAWEDIKIVIVTAEPHIFAGSSGYGPGEPYTNSFYSSSLGLLYNAVERAYYSPYKTFNFDFDFSLESWAKQGILLLNLSLSVRKNEPGSHEKPWNKFVSEVLNQINERKTGIIFLLIGDRPCKLGDHISKNHYVFKTKALKDYVGEKKEFPENVFLDIDKIMVDLYNEKINW